MVRSFQRVNSFQLTVRRKEFEQDRSFYSVQGCETNNVPMPGTTATAAAELPNSKTISTAERLLP